MTIEHQDVARNIRALAGVLPLQNSGQHDHHPPMKFGFAYGASIPSRIDAFRAPFRDCTMNTNRSDAAVISQRPSV